MMRILESDFGKTPDGDQAWLYSLKNSNGMIVNITNYGGIVTEIYTPNKNGIFENVCLGFKTMEDYKDNRAYFGALIGRYANRISNGTFKINNVNFQLSKNEGSHHLHGGNIGFDKKLWRASYQCTELIAKLELQYLSVDGEEGYPGNCLVTAVYELNNLNELSLILTAECDQATPINLTQHSYFNLKGSGDITGHSVKINSEFYCPIDETHLPTGKISNVSQTPMDLRSATDLGELINKDQEQIRIGRGFNHYFFIDKDPYFHQPTMKLAVTVLDPNSGRGLEIYTKEPGIQFYSAGFFNAYPNSGLCFEAQHCPNSINDNKLPSTILNPGEIYTSETRYRFFTAE